MTVEMLIPALALFTLLAGAVFGVYRLMRVRSKQKHADARR